MILMVMMMKKILKMLHEVSLSLTVDPLPDPRRSFTMLRGFSNYKETGGRHTPFSWTLPSFCQ